MEQSIPKRRHIKFRRRGITQKKAYNIQNKAKVWNQKHIFTNTYCKRIYNLICFLHVSAFDYFTAVSFKLFGCELPEDGDQPKHVVGR